MTSPFLRSSNSTTTNTTTTTGNNGFSGNSNTGQPPQQKSNDGTAPAPFFFLIVLFILMIVFFCCNSPFMRRLFGASPPEPPQPSQQQQQQQRTRPRREGPSEEDKAARIEFVKANLPFRIVNAVVGDEETGDATASVSASQRRSSRGLQRLSLSIRSGLGSSVEDAAAVRTSNTQSVGERSSFHTQGSTSKIPICSICLSGYYKGDEVAYSNNPSCNHEYHRDCIEDWLALHEDCPLCRNVFLPKDLAEATATTTTTTSSTTTTTPITTTHTHHQHDSVPIVQPPADQLERRRHASMQNESVTSTEAETRQEA